MIRSVDRKTEQGSFIVMAALLMTSILIAVGLVVDIGLTKSDSRRAQNAADAAALAAVLKLSTSHDAAVNEATRVATLNGFTTSGSDPLVTVNNPPSSGPKVGDANSVEVIISGTRNASFSRIIPGRTNVAYTARTVATVKNGNVNVGPCVFCVLSRSTAAPTWNQVGTKDVYVQNGAIAVRSTRNPAIDISGNAEVEVTINIAGLSPLFATRGGHRLGGSVGVTPAITDNYQDFDDPLAALPMPTPVVGTAVANGTSFAGCTLSGSNPPNITSCTGTVTIPAAKYGTISIGGGNVTMAAGSVVTGQINAGGGNLTINGPVSALGGVRSTGANLTLGPGTYGGTTNSLDITSTGSVTFQAGIYTFASDWDITGNGAMSGSNILLYFTCHNANGSARVCNANGTTADGDAVGEVGAAAKMAGGNATTLNGRTSADTTYGGMLMIFDRNNTGELRIAGNNTVSAPMSGTVYAKSAQLTTTGTVTGSLPAASAFIVGRYAPAGNGDLRLNFDQSKNATVDLVTTGPSGSNLLE